MTKQQSLIAYISQVWLDGDVDGFDEETPIGELNIIDSAGMFDLVHHLQGEFGVKVPLQEMKPENFHSVRTISNLVERLQRSA